MSCGKPHETPCTEVLSLIYVYLDDEIDEVRRVQITTHLGECPPCEEQFSIEVAFKRRIQQCCRSGPAPDDLRTRIVTQVSEWRVQYRSE